MTATLQLKLQGLNCGSCVGRAEAALRGVPGVSVANVNLANATAHVTYAAPADPHELGHALAAAGYPAVSEKVVFEVGNMSCASCVGRVEAAFAAVNGVLDVSVNLASETATVTFAQGTTSTAQLAKIAENAGYPAVLRETQTPISDRKADEATALTRNFWIAMILTLPVFVIEMGGHFIPDVHHWVARTIGIQNSWMLQFVLVTLVLAVPGRMFFAKGLPSLWHGRPDMNALVAIGTGAAWLFSTIATFIPAMLPAGTAAVYFEAAAVIVTLILLGRLLEARAKGRTGEAIRKLVGLQPKTALVVIEGESRETPLAQLAVGDVVRVLPGVRIAADGVVCDGQSYVDESMISGEPVPVEKTIADTVTGGTVNGAGRLDFTVSKTGEDTMLAQIIRMVEDAQGAKLPIQELVNKITMWFVPAVLALAVLTVLAWLAFGPDPALGFALVAGVAVLIVACPCAMGLATPTSIMVGTGRAAQMGVLFRKGDALQALHKANIVAFDKTGTLTQGRPALTTFEVATGFDETQTLRLLASVEVMSEHPIAQAIVDDARAKDIAMSEISDFESLTGFGVSALVEGHTVLVGADRLMARDGIALGGLETRGKEIAGAGETPLFVAINGKIAALVGVSDPVKPMSAAAVNALHAMGKKVALITGDNARTAQVIADALGIDHVVAEVLPAGKIDALNALRNGQEPIAFVGDGINDAPALAAADVGIAIGTGTDVAIESADVVLMSGDIGGVVRAFDVSRRTMRNIKQNLFWAFAYNAALIPVAAGALYIFGGPLLSPMLAAGAMALSSVFVLSNALRLRWIPIEAKAKR